MTYQEELEKFLEVLEQNQEIPSFFKESFLDFKLENQQVSGKKIGVIGDSFYSLYVKAYGMEPVWLSGGGYFAGEMVDMFPQISDPVAKSAMGLLLDEELKLTETLAGVLVVAKNDSYKKTIAYLKEMGIKVIQVEPIPYIREGLPFALFRQQVIALNDISQLILGVFRENLFKKELNLYQQAYELFAEDSFLALPTIVRDFFVHVFHTTAEKEQFCEELEEFLEDKTQEIPPHQVTVFGSPICLPNYKLYQVFQDIGITHFDNQCQSFPNYEEFDFTGGTVSLLKHAFEFQHKSAYIPATVGEMEKRVMPENSGGVVYYLLKGQTSEAYETDRLEEIALAQGVSYICVETDYTYTDSEQMKIRIEAFYEMLRAAQKVKA